MPDQPPANLVMNAVDTASLINTLGSLYSNATNHLIAVSVGAAALIGLILPLLAALYQARSLREEREGLIKIIKEEVESAKEKLFEDFKIDQAKQFKLLNNDMAIMKGILTEDISKLEAYLLGNILTAVSHQLAQHSTSLYGFKPLILALDNYAKAGKEGEMRGTMEGLLEVFEHLIKNSLKLDAETQSIFNYAISSVEKLNINHRYDIDIKRLRDAFNRLHGNTVQ